MEMPREVGPPFGVVVGLNPADRHGECLPHFVDELNGGLNGVVVVDLEDTVAGGFVDRGELLEAARLRLEMLDVHLDRLSGDMQFGPPLQYHEERNHHGLGNAFIGSTRPVASGFVAVTARPCGWLHYYTKPRERGANFRAVPHRRDVG